LVLPVLLFDNDEVLLFEDEDEEVEVVIDVFANIVSILAAIKVSVPLPEVAPGL